MPKPTSPFISAFLMAYSDSSFTNPHEVVLPDDPPDCTDQFTHMGKKYWGLETKRHCANRVDLEGEAYSFDHDAHNWFNIGLKKRSVVDCITISTKWFTGNQVPAVSVYLIDEMMGGARVQVLDRAPLQPDADHAFPIDPVSATEIWVDIYHEGGIARVNCFGVEAEEQLRNRQNRLLGAKITHISNEHYGRPLDAVLGEREPMHMFGWESSRSGYGERALFHLSEEIAADSLVVDTYLHRLNPPLACHVFGLRLKEGDDLDAVMDIMPRYKLVFGDGHEVVPESLRDYMNAQRYLDEPVEEPRRFQVKLNYKEGGPWLPLVTFGQLFADTYHRFQLVKKGTVISHLLFMFYPNGGIHGLKLHGKPANSEKS